jgi:hypothetical protein
MLLSLGMFNGLIACFSMEVMASSMACGLTVWEELNPTIAFSSTRASRSSNWWLCIIPSLLTMMAETPCLMASRIVPAPMFSSSFTAVSDQKLARGDVVVELWSQVKNLAVHELRSVLDLVSRSTLSLFYLPHWNTTLL